MSDYTLPQSELYTKWKTAIERLAALKKRMHLDFVLPELQALAQDVLFLGRAAMQEPRLNASLHLLANEIVSTLEVAFTCKCTSCSAKRKVQKNG